MATTTTGFVIRVFAGRAGLFTATLLPLSGAAPVEVQVSDLDGEPERFNERLTKVRLFREAMSKAEPVVVDHAPAQAGGNEVESVRCPTRDHLLTGQNVGEVVGIVGAVAVREQSAATAHSEHSDVAEVWIVDPSTRDISSCLLALQRAERGTPSAMLDMLRDAVASGEPVHVRVMRADSTVGEPNQWIIAVSPAALTAEAPLALDGFVERITSDVVRQVRFAQVAITTTPRFVAAGGVVDPSYFRPRTFSCWVAEGSPMYGLLSQALNAGQRVRVLLASERKTEKPREDVNVASHREAVATYGNVAKGATWSAASNTAPGADTAGAAAEKIPDLGVVLGVHLLAPLASAARPVWVRVRREALDRPPPGMCGGPVPSSDLSPINVASLQVPHRAAWEGVGCFNRGVYRIQVVSPVPVRMLVDGKELTCVIALPVTAAELHQLEGEQPLLPKGAAPAKPGMTELPNLPEPERPRERLHVYSGHVFLEDCHVVRVEVDEWRCGNVFELDVMKLR